MKFALFISNRTTFPQQLVAEAINEIADAVKKSGHTPLIPPEGVADDAGALRYAEFLKTQDCDGVIAVFPNFGDESSCLTALRDFGKPILFTACSDRLDAMDAARRRDAFCGKISAVNLFRQCRIPCTVLEPHTIEPSGADFQDNLKTFAAVCRVVNGMKNLRTGSIGARCTPFKTVRFDETALEKYHITNEAFDLSELFALIKTLADNNERVLAKAEFIKNYSRWPVNTAPVQLRMAKLAVAVETMIEKYRLDLVTLRCWTELEEELKLSPCMVLSMLNDRRITANCEVDTVNAIGMHALALAADAPAACLDWNNNYGNELNKCVLFHCGPTAASLMKPSAKIVDHPMFARVLGCGNGLGCNEGRMKPGDFTWLSGMTREGKLIFALDKGKFTEDELPSEFFGCGGVAEFENFQKKLRTMLRHGFPHHMSLSYGDSFTALEEAFYSYLGYETITF
ncbi:MAG: hypothetical protein IKD10_01215 [Lentisphaeria bacterium]|nr:hypothetical protein [Lentisphaeria bacterium]MBR7143536.1 hypothetical protein [Lentisphaeria bacterium]